MAPAPQRLTRWSPLTCLPRASLTPSGLLELDVSDGEVELTRRVDTELRAEDRMVPLLPDGNVASTAGLDWIDRDVELQVTLTTHRIVVRPQNDDGISTAPSSAHNACYLHLSNVTSAFVSYGNGMIQAFAAPRLTLQSYMGNLVLVFRGNIVDAKKDRDDFLERLQKALQRKAWETAQRLQAKNKTSQQVARRRVGVDAVMTKHTLRHKEAARLTHDAFQGDAETLLREAAELVTVIHKYVSTLEKHDSNNDTNSDAARLSDMLQNMGMTSALAKDQFRGVQHDEYSTTLARQVADFLRPLLPMAGGVMTLTDVYCLYNRARGTNLISPEDLLDAVGCMKRLNLGMTERTFPTSGVKVVQDDRFDEQVMATKLQELANSQHSGHVGLTAMDVSRELHISAMLAHEQLLASEHMGYLCRDETLETTRFFPNRFPEFSWST